jgi:hypothetical protein
MVALYRRNDSFGTLWAIPHLDPSGASAATASDTIEGVATAAGTLAVYIGGERYALTVAAGHDAATIAATIAAAVNADPFALVTAATGDAAPPQGDPETTGETGRRGPPAPRAPVAPRAGGSTVTYTTKNHGVIANELVRTVNFRGAAGGEIMPPGVTITGSGSNGASFAGGAPGCPIWPEDSTRGSADGVGRARRGDHVPAREPGHCSSRQYQGSSTEPRNTPARSFYKRFPKLLIALGLPAGTLDWKAHMFQTAENIRHRFFHGDR